MLTLTILCLFLYCAPGSKYSAQLHDLDGLPSASEQEALQSTTSLFEVITDSSLILGPEHEKKNLSDQSGTGTVLF